MSRNGHQRGARVPAVATWSDTDFLAAVESGRLGLDPWHPGDLTPNGIDLRIAEVLVPGTAAEPVRSGVASVPPMARFLIATEQVVRMPADACGQLWIRSSYARRGVLASFGKVEAGFDGSLTIAAFNTSHERLEIPIGDRFCQLVLEQLQSPPQALYAERSGNYQNQRGVTLAKE